MSRQEDRVIALKCFGCTKIERASSERQHAVSGAFMTLREKITVAEVSIAWRTEFLAESSSIWQRRRLGTRRQALVIMEIAQRSTHQQWRQPVRRRCMT